MALLLISTWPALVRFTRSDCLTWYSLKHRSAIRETIINFTVEGYCNLKVHVSASISQYLNIILQILGNICLFYISAGSIIHGFNIPTL